KRARHSATLLPNGKVLVAGGIDVAETLSSAELYDPSSGTWSSTGSLITPREEPTATLLPNGQVLVCGGGEDTTELYDPASGAWAATGSLATDRLHETATLLLDGEVLVAGGQDSGTLASAEVYKVGLGFSDAWQPQIATAQFRAGHRLELTGSLFQ